MLCPEARILLARQHFFVVYAKTAVIRFGVLSAHADTDPVPSLTSET